MMISMVFKKRERKDNRHRDTYRTAFRKHTFGFIRQTDRDNGRSKEEEVKNSSHD